MKARPRKSSIQNSVEVGRPEFRRTVQRPKTAVVVADAIAEHIFSKRLKPGTVLATEARMIADFGVGRATLREALRLLEAEGLIVVRAGPHGGAIVQQPSPDRLARLLSILLTLAGTTLLEVVEARRLVEPALAMLAAVNASDADLARLADAVVRLRQAVQDGSVDPDRFRDATTEFHTIIAAASGNGALSALWFAVSKISDGQEIGVHYGPDAMRAALAAHQKIADAIRNRNPQRASEAMTRHLAGHIAYLTESYPKVLGRAVRMVDGSEDIKYAPLGNANASDGFENTT